MSRTHWRACVISKMQTQELLINFYCSEEFRQGLDSQIICLSVINMLLGITAIFGNNVILIALCKETSLHKPFKVLLRNLVVSDLCVGFVQLLFGGYTIFVLQGGWQTCHLLYSVHDIVAKISITASLWTITAISVDRLLALLLKLRYRQVVTIRKVYALAIASWVCNGIINVLLWCFSSDAWTVFLETNIAVCLTTSTYCYTRVFFRLRQQQTQVHINPGDPGNQITRVGMTRYRKTVFSALWLQLALLFCYLPYSLLGPFALREIENTSSYAIFKPFMTTITLVFLNSILNPILYCWRIKEVRREVKDTLSCSRM